PTGEELLFRHAKKATDYDNFHGHEYPFIGWNELTKYPTSELYDKLMSTNRSSFSPKRDTPRKMGHNGGPPLEDDHGEPLYDTPNGKPLPPIPLEVFSTTNPNGPGTIGLSCGSLRAPKTAKSCAKKSRCLTRKHNATKLLLKRR
ncbi:hypothetical protein, partial [Citromicrobium sp. JLT1363]|uniref:hypothetical protein n=1 Tax=Citromicrobium sp. JLT1363 TaxID=517722 RepID=UPI001ED97FFA